MDNYSNEKLNISLISDIILKPYIDYLLIEKFAPLNLEIYFIPYDEYHSCGNKERLTTSDVIIIFINFEFIFDNKLNLLYSQAVSEQDVTDEVVGICRDLYNYVSSLSSAQIIWFSFEDYNMKLWHVAGRIPIGKGIIDKINICNHDFLYRKATFVDLKHIIACLGISNAYSHKSKYRWNAPYSKALIEIAADEIYKQYLVEHGITKKCLILDCDNVLWGGIISEDGIENVKLGRSGSGRMYRDFQRFILFLYYHGVIIAICSKNDLSDVMSMFRGHDDMILKEEHIAYFKVNWKNKCENIIEIVNILNIGLDKVVFIDDSPFEVESIKSLLPEVSSILYESESIYSKMSCFNFSGKGQVADIIKRNISYQTHQMRMELKVRYDSFDDYINALEIKIDIHNSLPSEFKRMSELTQRTNRCTNGKRYTVSQIKERICIGNTFYSLFITDRFSDLGLVGVIEVKCNTLVLFAISCRALGRDVDKFIFEFIKERHEILKIEFKSSNKNEDMLKIFSSGFPEAKIV